MKFIIKLVKDEKLKKVITYNIVSKMLFTIVSLTIIVSLINTVSNIFNKDLSSLGRSISILIYSLLTFIYLYIYICGHVGLILINSESKNIAKNKLRKAKTIDSMDGVIDDILARITGFK